MAETKARILSEIAASVDSVGPDGISFAKPLKVSGTDVSSNTGVTAGTYGSASQVPVFTVNAKGTLDSAGSVSVAGVSSTSFDSATRNFTINTADGGSYTTMISAANGEAGTYGSASQVPVLTINRFGEVDSIGTVSVAGVSSTAWDSSTGDLIISTADGGSFYTNVTLDPYSTTDLSEGTNKYYTSARADSDAKNAISVSGGNISYVPSTGVITVADSLQADAIAFDTNYGHITYSEGAVWYDNTHRTLNYYSDIANVIHELGTEEHQRVYNNTGSTITKGAPLYFSGNYTSGPIDVPTVGLADATDVNAYNAQGLAAADIADGAYGYCIVSGQIDGVNTSGLTAGQNFFVGLSPGAVQNASPTYPNYPMCLGWVVASDSNDGVLLVNQQNHSVNSFRVRTSAHIGTDLQVDGNLTILGSQTIASSENISIGGAFNYFNAGDTIGEANTTFIGSGLDDAFFSGHYNGTASNKNFYVKIDATGTPDTFEWGYDSASPVATGISITGAAQGLSDGISIDFGATTGHTSGDKWTGSASPVDVDTGWASNRNTGTSGVGYTHLGMFFDASDSRFKIFDEYYPEPEGSINTSDSSFSYGDFQANIVYANLVGNVTGTTSSLTNHTTDALSEGSTNLYYTTARVNSAFDTRLATKSTTNLAEGTNLYYTSARANSDFDTRLATKTTTNLSEGTNLYYTTARANSAIDARVTQSFVNALNVDADTLDGINSASFLRSDTADTASGQITFTATNNIIRVGNTNNTSTAETTGLNLHGAYTDGRYANRFRKYDHGGGVPLYIDGSSGTANVWTAIARFGTYSGNSYEFDVFGDIHASGDIISSSDVRLKGDINTIPDALNKVSQLRGVEFTKNNEMNAIKHIGLIAQEVEEIIPEVVTEDENGYKSVAYANIVGLLIEAIKEQQTQIEELKGMLENK
jgi:hypothetical protein